ncbi:restriction endonuclease subunit S [Aerococcaceae bacterium zg-B36]|nr:restriction endonuclease subunit S [Aerococcaceae bacterium zg-B36]
MYKITFNIDRKPYEKLADGTVQEVEVPYDIPESWEWVRLENISRLINDGTHSTPHYTERGIPFLSVKDISSGFLDFSNTRYISPQEHELLFKRANPERGDILLSKVGTTGIPVKVDTDTEFSIFVSLALIKLLQPINPDFMVYLMKAPVIFNQSKEGTRGVGNKNLVLQTIKKFLIPLPPLAEQKRIVDQIERTLEKVDEYTESYNKLQDLDKTFPDQLKKSILQYAMQGKLVAQDPNDEPVEVLLEKIKAEKQKLFEEGKLKKKDLEEMVVVTGDDNSPYGKKNVFDIDFQRKSSWLLLPLEKIVVSIPTKNHQIKQSDIKEIGMFPVVSQSQALVEGFSDNKTKVLHNQESLIIFGDHTRTLKLIDFSFVIGADGVKILKPIGISSKFLKYHLEYTILFVKKRGYARHYSYLKHKLIGIPSTIEQNRIATKIDLLFEKVSQFYS